jgi:hypothetical protein
LQRAPLFLLLTGCSSFVLLGNATAVKPGHFELGAMAGYQSAQLRIDPAPVTFAALARYGVVDHADLGLRAFTSGLAVEVRYQFYESPPDDVPALSAMITAAGGARGASVFGCSRATCVFSFDGTVGFAHVGLPVGIKFRRIELIVSGDLDVVLPTPGAWLWAGGQAAIWVELPGGFRIGPQGSLLMPIIIGPANGGPGRAPVTAPEGHVGLGVLRTF